MLKLLVPVSAAFAFGLYPAASQIAYRDGANATFVILFTTFFRALSLAVFCLATKKQIIPKPSEWRWAITGGFFQAASIFGIIGSLVYLPGPVTIILVFTHTIMLLLFLAYKKEIQLTPSAVVSTLMALIGVSLVVDVWSQTADLRWIGIALAMISALATVSRLYVFGKQVQEFDPSVVGARVFTFAFLFLSVLAFFSPPAFPTSSTGYSAALWSSLSLCIGTFGMFYGISLIGSFKYSLMAKLEPIFTALFSYFVLHEVLNSHQYLGMLLVITSLAAYQYFSTATQEK